MFCPVEYRESMLLLRGLVILVVIVILGVSVTEQQLNTLTGRQECAGTFKINYDQSGIYSIYILGSNYQMRAVYSVGQIASSDKTIMITMMNHSIKVPIYLEMDCQQELTFLDLEARFMVKKAFYFKQRWGLCQSMLQEKINVYISRFR